MIFSFSEKLRFALLFSLYLHFGCHIPPDTGTQVPRQFVSCPLPRIGHWAEIPWSIPLLSLYHYLGAGSGQIVEHQSLKGSLAQIFLDPYSKHVEDFLVKISCFFFAAGSGQMVEEESLNNFLEQVFQDPNPHEDRFTAQAQCQNLKLRKPQEPGKVETA